MHKLSILFISILFIACQQKRSTPTDSINPIIGNLSYEKQFGNTPNNSTDEQLRISTHLTYVENLLRKKTTTHLNKEQIASRNKMLDKLHDYIENGIFPKNYDYPNERKPCFIDKDGNICAVGYLVEQSTGLDAAEEINTLFQYATIDEMKSELLENWIANSGLSKTEVAMIQPTYGSRHNEEYVGKNLAIPSIALNAINLSSNIISLSDWKKHKRNKTMAKLGIISGALSINYSVLSRLYSHIHYAPTKAQKQVYRTNMIFGAATIGLNVVKLARDKKFKNQDISLNLNIEPSYFQEPIYGLRLTKKL